MEKDIEDEGKEVMANLNKKMLAQGGAGKSKKQLNHVPEDLEEDYDKIQEDDDEDDIDDEGEGLAEEEIVSKRTKGGKLDTVVLKENPDEKMKNIEKAVYKNQNKGKNNNANHKKKKKFN